MASENISVPAEGQMTEFRKYLNESGITEALTKILSKLYQEKEAPEDIVQYLLESLNKSEASVAVQKRADFLQSELNDRIKKLEEKDAEIAELKDRLVKYEGDDQGENENDDEFYENFKLKDF